MVNVNVIGRLGSEPKLETLEKGTQLYSLSLATDDYRNSKNETIWCRVTVFNQNLFNKISKLKKGSLISVQGNARVSAYIDKKSNEPVGQFDILAYNIDYVNIGNRNNDESKQATSSSQETHTVQSQDPPVFSPEMMEKAMANSLSNSGSNDNSDDLPF